MEHLLNSLGDLVDIISCLIVGFVIFMILGAWAEAENELNEEMKEAKK